MGFIHGLHRRNLKGDLLGGLTAAVVALPLALAFGNAALGPGGAIYGLYGAIITGFLAALLGGTPAQVSGPTGPMSVTVAGVVSSLAAVGVNQDLSAGEILPMVMAAVVIGGVCEVLLGVLRLGRFITLVPYSVVSGFMSGIGFIILVLQLGPFVGITTRGGVVDSLQTLANSPGLNPAALAVGVMTLAVVFLSPLRLRQWIPSPLLALVIVTPLSLLFFNDDRLNALGLEPLARIGAIPEGGLQLVMPNFSEHLPELVKAGLVLALLGAIDSLLTSLVADNITQTSHNSNRELIGQGMANTAAGFLSGLPGAGATMRTVINIKSGGATPLSGMSHSLVLLVVLLGAGPLAAQIPTALLAGILIKVGLDIIDWGFLLRAHRLSGKTAVLMYSVLLMTVFWDLIWGVLVGMFVANLLTVDSITQTQLEGMDADNPPDAAEVRLHDLTAEEKSLVDQCGNALMLFRLRGPLSFGAAKGISARMGLIQNYKVLILDITEVPRIGISASLAIERMVQEAQTSGRTILIAGANSKLQQRLRQFGVHGELVNSRREALQIAAQDISA
ncbi:MAG: SulP family inorganic anion transporter [Parasynechococcus sp.]|jgi:SulP family sulfate permease|uniref:SulP family inorganic anion transporter n=1 Tax=Parasynechococcus sp. TaxID=3101203 RepID=UPI000E171440|nr:MAG: SulP family inorganic anion transporter [Synechococcus sp. MED-G69]|tara:strand:+ start:1463 stop:3145 length:1683 start_codon:yes stop_codon:yes gene_type:complete